MRIWAEVYLFSPSVCMTVTGAILVLAEKQVTFVGLTPTRFWYLVACLVVVAELFERGKATDLQALDGNVYNILPKSSTARM